MLDIKRLRADPEKIGRRLKDKDDTVDLHLILSLDDRIRELRQEDEELKHRRRSLSKAIGERKRKKEDATELLQEADGVAERVTVLDKELRTLEEELFHKVAALPNIPLDDVKEGVDPIDNVLLKEHGTRPHFSYPPQHHLELNERLHLFDFIRGAKVSGHGWPVYSGLGARLEWALLQYMMNHHLNNGFEPYLLPHLVRPEIMFGVGQLPKFESQLFKIKDDDYHLYLIPTAEAVLNGLHTNEIFTADELPKKYVAYTPCFRREAGAGGAQERGLIRVHQFNKVEMFGFAKPEESEKLFIEMVESAEAIVEGLGLHYRRMALVAGDLAVPAARTYDIEVWLPGQDRYYEVSSVSLCTDYQARRSKIRFKRGQEKPELVHTLNGSGVATPRLMVALLENNQQEDGSVIVPEVLRPYLGGLEALVPTE